MNQTKILHIVLYSFFLSLHLSSADRQDPLLRRALVTRESITTRYLNTSSRLNSADNNYTMEQTRNIEELNFQISQVQNAAREIQHDLDILKQNKKNNQKLAERLELRLEKLKRLSNSEQSDAYQDNSDYFTQAPISITTSVIFIGAAWVLLSILEDLQQKVGLHSKLQEQIYQCQNNLTFATQECIYHSHYSLYSIKKNCFDNYIEQAAQATYNLPTTPNPNFNYPVVLYQKPEYITWQPQTYRQCKEKTK